MNKSKRLAVLGLYTAVTVILQFSSYFLPKLPGGFSVSLVMVPITVCAVIYGPASGGFIGAVFGIVTLICAIFGIDAGGLILWNSSPLALSAVCIVKGAAAGFCAGCVSSILRNKNRHLFCIFAAITAPVVNTGLFAAAMLTLFRPSLAQWMESAGSADVITYLLTVLIGINFIIELSVNVILTPVIRSVADNIKHIR